HLAQCRGDPPRQLCSKGRRAALDPDPGRTRRAAAGSRSDDPGALSCRARCRPGPPHRRICGAPKCYPSAPLAPNDALCRSKRVMSAFATRLRRAGRNGLASPRRLGRFCRYALVLIAFACLPARAQAQVETGRSAAFDHLGRGTVAFRTGDMAAAVQEWSEAIRLARLIAAPDLAAQALARRGEAYRTQGHLRDADVDLRAAL